MTVVAARGKGNLPDYALLCKAFGIPFFGLFDMDGKDASHPENRRNLDAFSDDVIHAFSSSFEELLGIPGEKHKASRTLARIDLISTTEIPEEIVAAIQRISEWARQD